MSTATGTASSLAHGFFEADPTVVALLVAALLVGAGVFTVARVRSGVRRARSSR